MTFAFSLGRITLMPNPWNKIIIPKEALKDLYENQKLSIAQISSKLGYSNSPIHRLLKEYQIKIRSISKAKEKFNISERELRNLYWKQRLSMKEIAKKYGCNHVTIVNRMKKYGIKSRGHLGLTKPIRIPKEKLEYLYHSRNLSLNKIAKILHRSESGLQRKMKNFQIKPRLLSNRACKYKKRDFNGLPSEKAYMIGFRLGDLNVTKSKNIIVARCSTAKQAQISLIKNLFSKYGGVSINKAKRGTIEIYAFLNSSFKFLLPKQDEIPIWIIKNSKYFLAFFSGYADAEGCLHLHIVKGKRIKSFGVFEIASYDKNILKQLWQGFTQLNITCPPPRICQLKGTPCGNKKYFSNKDAWRLMISKKESLWKLIYLWEKYSKHKDKKKAIIKARKNLVFRNKLPYCHKIDLSIPEIF